jgi:hypothetical protein
MPEREKNIHIQPSSSISRTHILSGTAGDRRRIEPVRVRLAAAGAVARNFDQSRDVYRSAGAAISAVYALEFDQGADEPRGG